MIVLATSNAEKNDSETGCLHPRFHYHFYLCGDSHVEAPLGAEALLVHDMWQTAKCHAGTYEVAAQLQIEPKGKGAEALLLRDFVERIEKGGNL